MVVEHHGWPVEGRLAHARAGQLRGKVLLVREYAPHAWQIFYADPNVSRHMVQIGLDVGDIVLEDSNIDDYLESLDLVWIDDPQVIAAQMLQYFSDERPPEKKRFWRRLRN